jgi:hypothetical protein
MPDPLPSQPGNIFDVAHVEGELARVREEIERAVLIAAGRRQHLGGPFPNLQLLRNREYELIVRRDALNGGAR